MTITMIKDNGTAKRFSMKWMRTTIMEIVAAIKIMKMKSHEVYDGGDRLCIL